MSQKSSNLQEFKANLLEHIRHNNHLFISTVKIMYYRCFRKTCFLKTSISFFPYVTRSKRHIFILAKSCLMGHTCEEERRTCNWHLRHIASAKLPKAHSGEHVLAIMSRISTHSLTTASWHLFPNTERSLGSLETGHTPNFKLCSHKNSLLRYLINHACLWAYCQMRKTEWHRKIIHFSPCTKKVFEVYPNIL